VDSKNARFFRGVLLLQGKAGDCAWILPVAEHGPGDAGQKTKYRRKNPDWRLHNKREQGLVPSIPRAPDQGTWTPAGSSPFRPPQRCGCRPDACGVGLFPV